MPGIVDAENNVLRSQLKDMRTAGCNIKKLLTGTRMNPGVRAQVMDELLWITNYYEAQKRQTLELYKEKKHGDS